MKITNTTTTKLIRDTLVSRDDFMTVKQLEAATQLTNRQVHTTLNYLIRVGCVEFIEQSDGRYYYAADERCDTRTWKVAERKPETEPRRKGNAAGRRHTLGGSNSVRNK